MIIKWSSALTLQTSSLSAMRLIPGGGFCNRIIPAFFNKGSVVKEIITTIMRLIAGSI